MKVFWSRCGHGYGNFGDKLTPLFLDLLKLPYQWAPAEEADLIGIGSLLEKIPDNYKGVVWTTGSMFETTRKHLSGAKILAVRGNFTAKNLGLSNDVATGDAGLLCDLLSQPSTKNVKLGIIPHFVDQQNPALSELASLHPGLRIIDVCAPTFDVIQEVAACEHILSSSLHGLILADSLSVPNGWVEFSGSAEAISGKGFKFRDYYSNFGLERMEPKYISGEESLHVLLAPLADYRRPNIEQLKERLFGSLEQLAVHFGGSIRNRLSLRELRQLEESKTAGREQWNREIAQTLSLLEKWVPAKERFILIDEEQIRSEVTHARSIPLIEENGVYWGAPLDDAHAIKKAEEHRSAGAQHVAIASMAFWWLDAYPEFRLWLEKNAQKLHADESLIVFRFRDGFGPR